MIARTGRARGGRVLRRCCSVAGVVQLGTATAKSIGDRIVNRKIEVARRQLGTALSLYLNDSDPVSVLCLAGGGCEVIEHFAAKGGGKPFVSHALEVHPSMDIGKLHGIQRKYWNAFKHALDRKGRERVDEELLAAFDDKQNDHMLFIGWYDYAQTMKKLPIEAQVHQIWYLALYPEKLDPKHSADLYVSQFPNLKTLPRSKQKLRLRKAITRARSDKRVMRDSRTENRPLIIGWP